MANKNEFAPSMLESSNGRRIFNQFLHAEFENADDLIQIFDKLTSMYFEVNSVINISALRTVDDVYIKHYLDSLAPHKHFSQGTICDVGCGGGFPTIPLAIVSDDTVTGVESVGKKLLLIHRSVSELHLKNLKSNYARSEDLIKLGRKYDNVCARALADTDKALGFCAPLAKSGGRIILYKSQTDKAAAPETLSKQKVKLLDTVDYVLYGTDINRRLYIYEKQ